MAMRVKAQLPEKDELQGEADPVVEDRTPVFADTNRGEQHDRPFTIPPLNVRIARLKALVAAGKSKRAVVCHTNNDPTDPMRWGVVVDVDAARPNPLEVCWIAGMRTFEDGTQLEVIYGGASQKDMHAWVKLKGAPQ